MTDQLFEVYLRTKDGDTYHPGTFREGITQFLSDEGYRISINIEGIVITLRRDMQVDEDIRFIDSHTHADSVDCLVTLRGHKLPHELDDSAWRDPETGVEMRDRI